MRGSRAGLQKYSGAGAERGVKAEQTAGVTEISLSAEWLV